MEAVSKMARRAFPRAAPVGPAATDIREALHAAGSRSDPRCCLDCPNVLLQVNASSLMAYTYRRRVSRRLPQVTQHSNPCTDPLPFTLRLEFGTIKDHMHSLSAPTRAGIDYCALENAFERKGAKSTHIKRLRTVDESACPRAFQYSDSDGFLSIQCIT